MRAVEGAAPTWVLGRKRAAGICVTLTPLSRPGLYPMLMAELSEEAVKESFLAQGVSASH